MKNELGRADFMVTSDRAIRRHWTLVCCAFAFCWWHTAAQARTADSSTQLAESLVTLPEAGEKNRQLQGADVLALPAARLADLGVLAGALLSRLR